MKKRTYTGEAGLLLLQEFNQDRYIKHFSKTYGLEKQYCNQLDIASTPQSRICHRREHGQHYFPSSRRCHAKSRWVDGTYFVNRFWPGRCDDLLHILSIETHSALVIWLGTHWSHFVFSCSFVGYVWLRIGIFNAAARHTRNGSGDLADRKRIQFNRRIS